MKEKKLKMHNLTLKEIRKKAKDWHRGRVLYPWDFKFPGATRVDDNEISRMATQIKKDNLHSIHTGDVLVMEDEGYVNVYQLIATTKKREAKVKG